VLWFHRVWDGASVPVVFRFQGFRFFFYSNEGEPPQPVQVHVLKGGLEAKFWLRPQVQAAYNWGYDARTLHMLLKVVHDNRELIEKGWNEFFR
jgi:hypothetical protein